MMSVVYPSETMAMFNIHSLQKRCFTTLSKELPFNMTNANLPSESKHMPNSRDSEAGSTSQVALCSEMNSTNLFEQKLM